VSSVCCGVLTSSDSVVDRCALDYRPAPIQCALRLSNRCGLDCGLGLWVPYVPKFFGMNGGDDGARTRDLCRDRSAFDRNPLKLWALMANKSTQKQWKTRVETPSAPYSPPSPTFSRPLQCSGKGLLSASFSVRACADLCRVQNWGAEESALAPLTHIRAYLSSRYGH